MSKERIEQIRELLENSSESQIPPHLGTVKSLIKEWYQLHKADNLTLEPMEAVGFEREILE